MDRAWRYTYGEYMRRLCGQMELRDWSVTTSEAHCVDGANASVEVIRGRKEALIKFCPSFEKRPREDNRQTCVHELLHCHTWGIRDAFDMANQNTSKKWFLNLWNQADIAEEYAIAAITDIIAPFMPLPPEGPMTAEEIAQLLEGNGHGKGQDAAAVSSAHPGHEDEAGRGSAGERGETPGGQRAEEGPEAPDEKEIDRSDVDRLFTGFADYLLSHPLR